MKHLFFFFGACYWIDQLGYTGSQWIPIAFVVAILADVFLFFLESFLKTSKAKG